MTIYTQTYRAVVDAANQAHKSINTLCYSPTVAKVLAVAESVFIGLTAYAFLKAGPFSTFKNALVLEAVVVSRAITWKPNQRATSFSLLQQAVRVPLVALAMYSKWGFIPLAAVTVALLCPPKGAI